MLIGELSKRTGLPRHTIRFYEKQGLITAREGNNPWNNYKEYTEHTLKRLLTVKRIKEFGFTLTEVAEFLALSDNKEASCHNVSQRFTDKVSLINQKIAELETLRNLMLNEVKNCPCYTPQVPDKDCPILIQ